MYRLKGTPAHFVGIIVDAPDEQTAITRAIEEYDVRPNERIASAAGLKPLVLRRAHVSLLPGCRGENDHDVGDAWL